MIFIDRPDDVTIFDVIALKEGVKLVLRGLLSYHPLELARRDPGWVWSRASQNMGNDNEIIEGMGGLVPGVRDALSPK